MTSAAHRSAVVIPLRPHLLRFTTGLLHAACCCRQLGAPCPVCREWDRRLRLRELVANEIARMV